MVFYIYKLANCNYIGITKDITQRTQNHNSSCYNSEKDKKLKVYKYIRENNIKIELIVLAVYKNEYTKKVKRLIEQFWINKYDSKNNGLNMLNALDNKEKRITEWRENNKEKITKQKKIYNKQFYQNNKEREKKRRKDYYKKNREYCLEYASNYLQKNREEIKKRKRIAYQKNKHKINIKINCPKCGTFTSKHHISEHQKTKKCKKLSLIKNNKK